MPTIRQYKAAIKRHNAKNCLKLTGTKAQLAARAKKAGAKLPAARRKKGRRVRGSMNLNRLFG